MKFLKVLSIALLATTVLFSCKKTNTPEDVTEKFMNHLIAGEFDKAKAYGTESTQQMMQMFQTLESLGGESFADGEPAKVGNIECDIDGDTAICRFEEEGEMSEVNLVKQDGKWLVDMKKENPFGDMDMDMDWDEDTEDMEDVEFYP